MKQFKIEDLHIEHIIITNASIENPDSINSEEHKPSLLQYGLGFERYMSVSNNKIKVVMYLEIQSKDPDNSFINVKGNFTTEFVFGVDDFNNYIEKDREGSVTYIEEQLTMSILNIVYSTSRGIIYTRCLGTVLGNVILPVLSSQYLLEISNKNANKDEDKMKVPKKVAKKKSATKRKTIKK